MSDGIPSEVSSDEEIIVEQVREWLKNGIFHWGKGIKASYYLFEGAICLYHLKPCQINPKNGGKPWIIFPNLGLDPTFSPLAIANVNFVHPCQNAIIINGVSAMILNFQPYFLFWGATFEGVKSYLKKSVRGGKKTGTLWR